MSGVLSNNIIIWLHDNWIVSGARNHIFTFRDILTQFIHTTPAEITICLVKVPLNPERNNFKSLVKKEDPT